MLERLLDIEVSQNGTVFEEIELICTMTGFRHRFLEIGRASCRERVFNIV
jgi:hypothetical protein